MAMPALRKTPRWKRRSGARPGEIAAAAFALFLEKGFAQVKKTLTNVEAALMEAGARRADVTSLRIFVVDYDLEKLPVIGEELSLFFGPDNLPANTLVGIDKLALPEFMVEIEAFAIID